MGTNRGATLESFLCKVACVGAPVVACTATASNLGALAAWLGAGLYETAECPTTVAIHLALAPTDAGEWRPHRGGRGAHLGEGGARVDERRLAVTAPADYDVGDAVVDKLCLDDPPGPVMLFVASRADARAAAVRLAERRWRGGGVQEKAACRARWPSGSGARAARRRARRGPARVLPTRRALPPRGPRGRGARNGRGRVRAQGLRRALLHHDAGRRRAPARGAGRRQGRRPATDGRGAPPDDRTSGPRRIWDQEGAVRVDRVRRR